MTNYIKHRFQAGMRILVVGDIHGDFESLAKALDYANYNEENDLLISVGDLVDRGPRNEDVVNFFFGHPNRLTVKGNHEDMYLMAMEHPYNVGNYIANGGGWVGNLTENQRSDYYDKFDKLPIVIEVELDSGELLGIVHAQVPVAFTTWDEFKRMVNAYAGTRQKAIWERSYAYGNALPIIIPDVDLVISGHTVVKQTKTVGNHLFIDTGSVFRDETHQYKLTMVVIDPNTNLSNYRIIQV